MAATTRLGPNYRKLFAATTISNLGDGVGIIAYPWLASAITRNPLLIAVVGVVQRLPWLLFTLPAGVITDRNDRRRLMVGANAARAVLTAAMAVAVLVRQDVIAAPDDIEQVVGTEWFLYVTILAATLLLGTCEVLYDNSAQTFMPAIVETEHLERANGRMYSAEIVANQFVGPPLAALLLVTGFVLPVVFDAATFAVSAGLVFAIVATKRAPAAADVAVERRPFKEEMAEGFRWLWHHSLLRTFAIALGALNLLANMSTAVMVLWGQEVLHTSTLQFGLLSTGAAIGGVAGGWTASAITKRIGSGASVGLTLWLGGGVTILIGFMSNWVVVGLLLVVTMFVAVLWNVITVSLRQAVIPDRLLGRVNSVYRFFGWGAIPIGTLLGGAIVAGLDGVMSREWALRMPWIVAGIAQLGLAAIVARSLTSARIDAARAGGPVEDPVAV
ncbi:MAG TPA: MFS transporter [Ilumatobacteraceae bacterium]|nr:MFS transporter [Ilumatobacteraceae bacterium]